MAISRKKQRGYTLIEMVVATGLSVMVLGVCLSILFAGSASWSTGLGNTAATSYAQNAVRTISKRLQEAMSVTVAANGQSLTYQLPQTDGQGNYLLPLAWDGVNRQILIQNNNQLVMVDGSQQEVVAYGVIFTDPLSPHGTKPYVPFTPGVGTTTNQVTIEVATQAYAHDTYGASTTVASRERETIYLRNIPQITSQS
jgi:type II secretory pathway pseudopilin PulG